MRTKERPPKTVAWTIAKILIAVGFMAIGLSIWTATRPLVNPSVQDCGPAVSFLVGDKPNTVIRPGEPGAPADAVALAEQPTCRELAIVQVQKAGLAAGAGVALILIGVITGLVDDRVALWRAPRFETLLRPVPRQDRVAFGLDPVVELDELGGDLPPFEQREVAGFVGASIAVVLGLPLLVGYKAVVSQIGNLVLVQVLLAAVFLALSFGASVLQRYGASGEAPGWSTRAQLMIASSWAGRLRPVLGAFGIDAHALRLSGRDSDDIDDEVGAMEWVSLFVTVAALVTTGIWFAGDDLPDVAFEFRTIPAIVVLMILVLNGLTSVQRRVAGMPVSPHRSALRYAGRLLPKTERLVALLVGSVVLLGANAGVLGASVAAFGGDVSAAHLVFVSTAMVTLGAIAGTPSGLVAAELAGTLLLIRLGVSPAGSVVSVLMARALVVWLPMLPGASLTARLRDRTIL